MKHVLPRTFYLNACLPFCLAGCVTLEVPTSPKKHTKVFIGSLPQGAALYAYDAKDGNLGAYIGDTPLTLDVGLAWRRWSDGRRYAPLVWAHGITFSAWRPEKKGWDIVLDVAATKAGFHTQTVSKVIGTLGRLHRYPPPNTSITIPLRPTHRDAASQPQQQQQQQQQTVVIPGVGKYRDDREKPGTVIVSSNVEAAEVFVDGVFVGNTPASLKLKEGIHIIEVKASGYQTYRRDMRVLADSEVALRAVLEK